mmetsp:Transcript_23827/g.33311  ORF Transcript_23827/g.33311 Transcript_23827/m.33311 type:complete len:333 (+) Transcript_23827:125-1123(+)
MTLAIYPDIVTEQNLSPDAFGYEVEETANEMYDAMKGWGSDAKKVIDLFATRDATDRYKIALRYKELHEKNLRDVFKKEFSGDFGTAMEFLALPSHEAECAMIQKACKGVGCAVNIVYTICCSRSNEEIDLLKKTYFKVYTKDLSKLLAKELHGDMERIVFNCLQGGEDPFDPQYHTKELAEEDAEEIYSNGQGRWFTKEKNIFKVLCRSPPEHIQAVSDAYAEKYGYTLMKAFEKELGGNDRNAAMFVLGMKLKPYEAIASVIKEACAGLGTDEMLLTCCLIRYQPVMREVYAAHIEMYGKTIHDRIRHETRGKYKDALLAIVNTVWPEEG